LDIGHEVEGEVGRVDWNYVYPPTGDVDYALVLHQVRHPLRVIESFHSAGNVSWGKILKADPQIRGGTLLQKCIRYWVRWNQVAERQAAWTFRVENMENILPRILLACGKDPLKIDWRSALEVSNTDHSRRGKHKHSSKIPTLTLANIQEAAPRDAEMVMEMASRYGYDLS